MTYLYKAVSTTSAALCEICCQAMKKVLGTLPWRLAGLMHQAVSLLSEAQEGISDKSSAKSEKIPMGIYEAARGNSARPENHRIT